MMIDAPQHKAIATLIWQVGLFIRRLQHHDIRKSTALNFALERFSFSFVQFGHIHSACFADHPCRRNPNFSLARAHIANGLSRFPSHYLSKAPDFVTRRLRPQKQKERQCRDNK
jgi:hypothetical protein